MKKVLSTLLLVSVFSNSEYVNFSELSQDIFNKSINHLKSKVSSINQDSGGMATRKVGKRIKFPINQRVLFSNRNCDKVITDALYTSCYDYNSKISLMMHYTVDGNLLRSNYIKERPRFYGDNQINRKYRVEYSDYTHSKHDRGHIRSHASSSWSKKSILETYSMVNVWGQRPNLNRIAWLKVEKYERLMARKFGRIEVLNIADISKANKRTGKRQVLIPNGFYKVIYNNSFKRCFYYSNHNNYSITDKMKSHIVSCDRIYY
ncbi:MAG: DNA/RNA non-specific endonuclease [uncultured Sulfurovum sp.]|uniref:Endonuclease n=1 Tax=uncultured Sulfurovum sp. TaxID=269237 RepID=A0A6S6SR88_9BACT|nr:MAG: DNA/RNA non-specific endonuclease [uncultured Sulfurovum sp.]